VIDTQIHLISDSYFDITPVDYIAKAMMYFITGHHKIYGTYHLLNPHAKSFSQVVAVIKDCGYAIQPISQEEYKKKIVNKGFMSHGRPYNSKTLELLDFNPDMIHEAANTRVDAQVTSSILSKEGIMCPVIDSQLLSLYIKKMIEVGYLSSNS
ncbi:MAG: hypothetical protein ACHQII_06580, partial [Bacteroidia bacterium]